jgi:hypothetical protein
MPELARGLILRGTTQMLSLLHLSLLEMVYGLVQTVAHQQPILLEIVRYLYLLTLQVIQSLYWDLVALKLRLVQEFDVR